MRNFDRRLRTIGEHVAAAREKERQKTPAWKNWLGILRIVLCAFERGEQTPEFVEATQRVRYSIALLEEYEAGEPHAEPWVYLEYYCHACVLRMNWPGFVPAYLDPEYDRQIQEIEGIERSRRVLPTMVMGA